jgi:hypothetical protein
VRQTPTGSCVDVAIQAPSDPGPLAIRATEPPPRARTGCFLTTEQQRGAAAVAPISHGASRSPVPPSQSAFSLVEYLVIAECAVGAASVVVGVLQLIA